MTTNKDEVFEKLTKANADFDKVKIGIKQTFSHYFRININDEMIDRLSKCFAEYLKAKEALIELCK